jgi:head-tail adaptor
MSQIIAPRRNKIVTIQTQTAARDAANAPLDEWTDGDTTLTVNISPQYQALTQSPQEFVSQATYRITFLWSRQLAIAVTNRVKWVDPSTTTVHIYQIKAIFPLDPNAPNTYVVCLAYEINGGA